jgi:hypothetical protein
MRVLWGALPPPGGRRRGRGASGITARATRAIRSLSEPWRRPHRRRSPVVDHDDLRATVRWAIEQFLPAEQLKILLAAEESERALITALVDTITNEGAA